MMEMDKSLLELSK